jgi:hypothetical protein
MLHCMSCGAICEDHEPRMSWPVTAVTIDEPYAMCPSCGGGDLQEAAECPECGNGCAPDADECPYCGTPHYDSPVQCDCGAWMDETGTCPRCGWNGEE